MKKVIINADDFGYSSGVNSGIIKSFQDGILSSTTLMANMPGCLEAIQLTKENPGLGIGGHLVLTCGKSLTDTLTLTRDTHVFYNLNEYHEHRKFMDQEEIFNEWCANSTRKLTFRYGL
ncbi:ChbG/HpnK family deacetylase [Enterococcus mundtii]|uniref:ChbG/HpnK family deacetylase n=1 Tax=Enterococcus mundtii TaxID=53346 RepID=UPI001CF43AA5|nr:ChbG/HpnK family deacetylase [Enterococcus mundtii]MCA6775451.1 ChbG/HpnK family deacetylase [Enterococcus mundtii]